MTEPHEDGNPHGDHTDPCAADGGERLAAEGEVAVARLAMDGGDLTHAASHLGFAMADDPRLPEIHEALAQLAVHCGGPEAALELFPTEHLYIGAAACRAHLCAAAGLWADAIDLLAAVMSIQPARPWSHVAWLDHPDLPDQLTPEAAANAVAKLVGGGLPGTLSPDLSEALAPFFALIRTMAAKHPDSTVLLVMASGLARRFADYDAAIDWAEQAAEIEPGHMPNIMLGYALREAGRTDEALKVWEAELARDPSDVSLHVDVAELYAATDRPAEGLTWLERALAIEPDHPKAAPAIHAVRFAMDEDPAHLLALTDHLRAHPEHEYAYMLLERLCRSVPWLGSIGFPTEATINVLRQVLEDGNLAPVSEIELSTSALEPPSALMAFRLVFPKASASCESVGDPDPRVPTADVTIQVWRFDAADLTAEPAVPPPSAHAAETIRGIAQLRWPHPMAAYDHAVHLSGLELDDLLGTLVHPPEFRHDDQGRHLAATVPDLWARAVQVFACLGIAHHKPDEPWPESTRRTVLHDLLFGPEDWVTEAAAMALVAIAWVDPDARDDIGTLIVRRMLDGAKAFQTRVVTIMGSLCRLTLACPWLTEDFTGLAQQILDVIEKLDTADPSESEEPQPLPPPTRQPRRFGRFGRRG